MFGRKARRIAELEQREARLLGIIDERDEAIEGLDARNAVLRDQLRALRESHTGDWLAERRRLLGVEELARRKALAAPVDVAAEVAEPRPYVTWNDPTPPRQAPGSDELADSEAPVVACPGCGQPSGAGHVCGNEIEEAA